LSSPPSASDPSDEPLPVVPSPSPAMAPARIAPPSASSSKPPIGRSPPAAQRRRELFGGRE
jgi:hypothetical protein